MMKPINQVYGRPHRNPNRWMITEVPVREERRIDWLSIASFAVVILVALYLAMALQMM